MAKIISIINMKGGVGKTTLSVNLAYGLSKYHHKRVLLVDVDPQFNATQYLYPISKYLEFMKKKGSCTIKDIFIDRPTEIMGTVTDEKKKADAVILSIANCAIRVYKNDSGFLDLIPSTLELMEADNMRRGIENRLKIFLDKVRDNYDYIIIDCPPTMSVFTASAYIASDAYLITIKPDYLSSVGISLLLRAMKNYEESYGISRKPIGIVFTMVMGNTTLAKQVMGQIRKAYSPKMKIFDNCMSHTTKIAKTVGENKTIFDIGGGRYSTEMKNITKEFLDTLEEEE
ncbi:MAG: ParA family protein [Nanoarchaeota archaeon]|nr:ParA family protein [Nanoarchaeota archaeon]